MNKKNHSEFKYTRIFTEISQSDIGVLKLTALWNCNSYLKQQFWTLLQKNLIPELWDGAQESAFITSTQATKRQAAQTHTCRNNPSSTPSHQASFPIPGSHRFAMAPSLIASPAHQEFQGPYCRVMLRSEKGPLHSVGPTPSDSQGDLMRSVVMGDNVAQELPLWGALERRDSKEPWMGFFLEEFLKLEPGSSPICLPPARFIPMTFRIVATITTSVQKS